MDLSAPSSDVALRGPEGGRIYKETGGEVFAFKSIKVEGVPFAVYYTLKIEMGLLCSVTDLHQYLMAESSN